MMKVNLKIGWGMMMMPYLFCKCMKIEFLYWQSIHSMRGRDELKSARKPIAINSVPTKVLERKKGADDEKQCRAYESAITACD